MLKKLLLVTQLTLTAACGTRQQPSEFDRIIDKQQEWNFLPKDHHLYKKVFIGFCSYSQMAFNAFPVTQHYLITNEHVLNVCRIQNCPLAILIENKLVPVTLIKRRWYLDYALLKTSDHVLTDYFEVADYTQDEEVFVLQHIIDRNTDQLTLALNRQKSDHGFMNNFPTIQYQLNTVHGSSGSPILNNKMQVIGVHKGHNDHNANHGFQFKDIKHSIQSKLIDELQFIIKLLDKTDNHNLRRDIFYILDEVINSNNNKLLVNIFQKLNQSKYKQEIYTYLTLIRGINLEQLGVNK